MIQSGGFLGRLLGPLLKTVLPLMKNVIKPLAKSLFVRINCSSISSNAGIHKKILGSDKHTSDSASRNNAILIISNDEMKDIIKIVKYLQVYYFKELAKQFKMKLKDEKEDFLVCY